MLDASARGGSQTAAKREGLLARSSWRATATIAAEYASIAIAVAIGKSFAGIWEYVLIVIFTGTRQYALGECMAHEASHRNLSRAIGLNEALGIAVCWPFFFTLAGYRRFHNRLHHGTSLANDDNSIYEDYEDWGLPPAEAPLSRSAAYWHLVVKPLVGVIGVRHLMKTLEDFYWDGDLVENTAMLFFWAAMFTIAATFGRLGDLLFYWIVPWLTVVPVLNYWSEVGDHYRVAGAETRSNLNWFLNATVAHNIGFHALHHRYPSIPWFRLPRAYSAFRHELDEQVSRGYVMTFRQIMAEEQSLRRMILTRHPM
jgi:fatty acid desaturase